MTKNKVDVHKLGHLILPACILAISAGFALIISAYSQVSADEKNYVGEYQTCMKDISAACKKLGYDEKCANSVIASEYITLEKLITTGNAQTEFNAENVTGNTTAEDVLSAPVKKCKTVLEKAKKMAKASTTSEEKTASGDQASSSGNTQTAGGDFSYMSNQGFAATSIISADSDSKCKGTKKGQIILVSNIKADSGSVQSAFYNSLDWTKRGKVFDISSEVKTSIIVKLKKENKLESVFGTTDEKIIEANLISGSVFYDVPLGQSLSGLVYSSSWSGKALVVPSFSGPKSECESTFIAVNYAEANTSLTDKYKVCVHSKDKSKDYKEKKTFIYPEDKTDAEAYKLADKDRIISLGPCQTDETSGGSSSGSSGSTSGGAGQNVGESNIGIGAADVPGGSSSGSSTSDSSGGSSIAEGAQLALKRLNEFRREQGKSEFVADNTLQSFAEYRAKYLSTLSYAQIAAAGGHPLFEEHVSERQIVAIEEVSTSQGTDDWTSLAQSLTVSPSHREGLIESSGKIGIVATTLTDGYVLVVELSR